MADDDKPFTCFEDGCKMRFTNEDHLAVHMKKHDMSLALNLGSQNLSPHGIYLDQTPTPTKFLRNCEEIGLFQELKHNPFVEALKKMADAPETSEDSSTDGSFPIPGPDLNTPQPPSINTPNILHVDMETSSKTLEFMRDTSLSSIVPKKRKKFLNSQVLPTSTTSDDDIEMYTPSSDGGGLILPKEDRLVVSSSTKEPSLTSIQQTTHSVAVPVQQPSKPMVIQQPSTIFLQLSNGQTIPLQLPQSMMPQGVAMAPQLQTVTVPIQSIPGLQSNTAAPKTIGSTHVPHNLIQNTVIQGTSGIVPISMGSVSNSVVQRTAGLGASVSLASTMPSVITVNTQPGVGGQQNIRTIMTAHHQQQQQQQHNSHQTVPGNTVISSLTNSNLSSASTTGIHTVISPISKVQTQSAVIMKTNEKQQAAMSTQSLAKQRLKAALQQQMTPTGSVKIAQMFQLRQEVKQEPQMSPRTIDSASTSDTNMSSPEEFMPMSVQYMKTESDDPEDRRKKFLERNRAAAARCREKRKHWIVNLEQKSDEMTNLNNKLQGEVSQLRGEVAQLKTLLLAHKDCPVTKQQKAQGQLAPAFSLIETSNSSEPVVNGLPNTSGATSQETIITMATVSPMTTSVFTGPNSVAMIPTVVNNFLHNKQNGS